MMNFCNFWSPNCPECKRENFYIYDYNISYEFKPFQVESCPFGFGYGEFSFDGVNSADHNLIWIVLKS